MNRVLREHLARRESGRRRVTWITKLSAIVAAAVAVAFGVGFAHQPSATNSSTGTSDSQPVAPQTTTDGSGDEYGDGSDETGQDNSQSDSGTLQPPVRLPDYRQNDGQASHGSSGGS
ncbi:hypothetical protein [Flindersiella endophytica]